MIGNSQILKIALCVGLIQVAGYYFSGSTVSSEATMAIAQPDTLLYCQAARRIVEGSPFSFSAGEAVCSGTTSVIYPFVLSVPYAIGMKGDSLLVAGFLLNAFFYMLFLFGWVKVFLSAFDSQFLRLYSSLLLAMSPQPAYCALAQSDIGLWLAVSGLFASAFFANRLIACTVLLVIGPWVRPEGMVLVLAFCAFAVCTRRKGDVVAAILGVASSLGVFALNLALTGRAQFSSVANKGYFSMFALPKAIYHAATDMMRLVKEFVLGMSDSPPRLFFMIPILGAVCIAVGVVSHKWKEKIGLKIGTLLLAAFGGLAMVSMSSWQNTNLDRYLAWTMPLALLFLAEGAVFVFNKIPCLNGRSLVLLLPAIYAAVASVVMVFVFHGLSCDATLVKTFGRECEALMPEGASIGGFSNCGLAYEFGNRRFAHLAGIYSPEFQVHTQEAVFEILKNEPQTRFDYWLYKPGVGLGDGFLRTFSDSIGVGPLGMELRKAKWDVFDNASEIPVCNGGFNCVARVDVGYEKDEAAAVYCVENRYEQVPFDLMTVIKKGPNNDREMIEVARMVAGLDKMTVPLELGKDAKVIMRTFSSCQVVSHGVFSSESVAYEITNPARLNLSVNGTIVGEVSFSASTNGFSDVEFTIPGGAITSSPSTIAFLGDHIACCYWFYQ